MTEAKSASVSATEAWTRGCAGDADRAALEEYVTGRRWLAPSRETFFFCDLHADADAFLRSLEASGGVRRTGPGDADLELTDRGRAARFVIGGDCFDKGPSNLRLLRTIGHLRGTGARVHVLAGNHDVRALIGLNALARKDVRYAHMFARLGKKAVTLFREVFDACLADRHPDAFLPEEEARALLFPSESWYAEFPAAAGGLLSDRVLDKELRRVREKARELEETARGLGMTLGMIEAAARKARELFVGDGELSWFYRSMSLALRAGSCLLLHAGVDDAVAELVARGGVQALNDEFERLFADDPFELYYGTVGNAFRTKYEPGDWVLSAHGARHLQSAGIHAIVHGHRNLTRGHRISLRAGLLHVECDTCVDVNSRERMGLRGPGHSCLTLGVDGTIAAVSSDYPRARVLQTPTSAPPPGSRL